MKIFDANDVERSMSFDLLIPAIEDAFGNPAGMPQRHVYELDQDPSNHNGFAVLPAWTKDAIGVKAFTYFPDNGSNGFERLYSKILLFRRDCGAPIAVVDGTSVTYWRTASVSALASRYLSRTDSSRLLVCGTGRLAPFMARAHATVRPIREIEVWGRSADKAQAIVDELKVARPDIECSVSPDLATSATRADIISCATGSSEPVVRGEWVTPGTHTDFVGSHTPHARESDTQLVASSEVFVDSRLNVLNEAGDVLIPINEGRFSADDVRGELSQLCSKEVAGRQNDEQRTLFKSVGTALSDIVGAMLVVKQAEA